MGRPLDTQWTGRRARQRRRLRARRSGLQRRFVERSPWGVLELRRRMLLWRWRRRWLLVSRAAHGNRRSLAPLKSALLLLFFSWRCLKGTGANSVSEVSLNASASYACEKLAQIGRQTLSGSVLDSAFLLLLSCWSSRTRVVFLNLYLCDILF